MFKSIVLKNNKTYNEKYIWSININYEEYCDKIVDMMGCKNNFCECKYMKKDKVIIDYIELF